MYTHVNLSFTIKVGFKWVKIIKVCFRDGVLTMVSSELMRLVYLEISLLFLLSLLHTETPIICYKYNNLVRNTKFNLNLFVSDLDT